MGEILEEEKDETGRVLWRKARCDSCAMIVKEEVHPDEAEGAPWLCADCFFHQKRVIHDDMELLVRDLIASIGRPTTDTLVRVEFISLCIEIVDRLDRLSGKKV
jgi:hypothetical protein